MADKKSSISMPTPSLSSDLHYGKSSGRRGIATGWRWLGAVVFGAIIAQAAEEQNFADLSIEELMEIRISIVSKHEERLSAAPAAVFALATDDLRRAGVANLPDALRLVPGMHVGGIGTNDWAISTRGFGDVFANKLLVLRDGRSLYTPLFSGVFWDTQETMLEDIERIEVVRGPGATLWGANAVNGVINIVSKSARDTQGLLVSAGAATNSDLRGALRYGGKAGERTHYRVFAKQLHYGDSAQPDGSDSVDEARAKVAGFRLDHETATGALFTFQGDGYFGQEQQVFIVPSLAPPFAATTPADNETRVEGGNLLARWTSAGEEDEQWSVQAYFDYSKRDVPILLTWQQTFDVELQRRMLIGSRQKLTVGAGFRTVSDRVESTAYVGLTPARTRLDLWNAFVEDDITLSRDWRLVLGTKVEHNGVTGFEVQPGARLLWIPDARQTAWASVARAVRTPSRTDTGLVLFGVTGQPGVLIDARGNPASESEELIAYEAGYRFQPAERVSFDLAVFFNDYDRLRTTEIAAMSAPPPPIFLSTRAGNLMRGQTHGGEIAVNAQLASSWRIRTNFTLLRMDFDLLPGSTDASSIAAASRSPRHQATLWSQHDLGRGWQLDWLLRYVDSIPVIRIPSMLELDARLAWRPVENWEIALAGHNLLSPHHREYPPTSVVIPAAEIRRRGTLEIRYQF